MKALTCEMCGSTNLVKTDGVFVCQSCGTKYSVEEARKMMVEGTVNIEGIVKIDTSNELSNLYKVARRAKENGNNEQAEKYYDKILSIDPNNWEANFYTVYYSAMQCNIAGITYSANSITKCIPTVIDLIQNYIPKEEQISIISEISTKVTNIASMFGNSACNHHYGISSEVRYEYTQEYIFRVNAARDIVYTFADKVDEVWGKNAKDSTIPAWELGIQLDNLILSLINNRRDTIQWMQLYADKIKKYKPEYNLPRLNGIGCYIATAVYGSYDCPEVWTLRRFRDFTLAETWYGRAFIKTYYATSPTLVRWFGESIWFKNLFQKPLDNLVKQLQDKGVANTPYNDRVW